jgi:putative ABC transport system permease protein
VKSLGIDLRFALRGLLRNPGFAAVAILTLALGIGANTAIFSVVDAALLRPLEYHEPERLVGVYTAFPTMGYEKFPISQPEVTELEERTESLSSIGAWVVGGAPVSGGTEPIRVRAAYCTAGLLPTLGSSPAMGRWYTADEDRPNGPDVVVISHGLWQGAFGGDASILGRAIRVDGEPRQVIGVMSAGFAFPTPGIDVWVPIEFDRAKPGGRGSHYLSVVGRLAPGATLASARAEMEALTTRSRDEGQDTHRHDPEKHPLRMFELRGELVGDVRTPVLLLFGAVGFVLLIACANVANLLLARAEGRIKEVAVRAALGADRMRLARQFLTESALLGLLGGAAGILVAVWGLDAILASLPEDVPLLASARLDARVLAFTAFVSLGTGCLFGFAPVLAVRFDDLHAALKATGQRATAGLGRARLRRALVVAETALAVVLLVGAGLMLKSFRALTHQDPGFDPVGLLTGEIELPRSDYPDDAQIADFWDRLCERIQTLPGVVSAAAMGGLPPTRRFNANDVYVDGYVPPPPNQGGNVDFWQIADERYFATMGIELSPDHPGGRLFEHTDRAGSELVCLVNEAMAKKFWPGREPIGGWLNNDGPDNPQHFRVVGVVRDVKQQGLEREVGTELYFPLAQSLDSSGPRRLMNVVVRAERDPLALAGPVRGLLREIDPLLALAKVRTMEDVMQESLLGQRALATLLAVFAALALALAAVGIYGVMSYSVAQRTNEIGIRIALGAQPAQVLRWVLGHALVLVVVGLGLGVAGAFALTRGLRGVLYEVSSTDPLTFAGVAFVILLVALVASYLPARRATRVDPLVALRTE